MLRSHSATTTCRLLVTVMNFALQLVLVILWLWCGASRSALVTIAIGLSEPFTRTILFGCPMDDPPYTSHYSNMDLHWTRRQDGHGVRQSSWQASRCDATRIAGLIVKISVPRWSIITLRSPHHMPRLQEEKTQI